MRPTGLASKKLWGSRTNRSRIVSRVSMSTRLATPVKIRLRRAEAMAATTLAPIRITPMLITASSESLPPVRALIKRMIPNGVTRASTFTTPELTSTSINSRRWGRRKGPYQAQLKRCSLLSGRRRSSRIGKRSPCSGWITSAFSVSGPSSGSSKRSWPSSLMPSSRVM